MIFFIALWISAVLPTQISKISQNSIPFPLEWIDTTLVQFEHKSFTIGLFRNMEVSGLKSITKSSKNYMEKPPTRVLPPSHFDGDLSSPQLLSLE